MLLEVLLLQSAPSRTGHAIAARSGFGKPSTPLAASRRSTAAPTATGLFALACRLCVCDGTGPT